MASRLWPARAGAEAAVRSREAATSRGRRRLDVSVRQSLGLVTYRAGEVSLGHEDYVFAVSGGRGAYPGFSDDPVESFCHFQRDLERHGDVFLKGARRSSPRSRNAPR